MKYLTFMRCSESFNAGAAPPAFMQAMGKFAEQSMKDGVLVDTAGLHPSRDASILRLERGEISVTDGPFTETKEIIGGYAIIQAKDKADVMRVAREFMELHRKHWPGFEGECEVRQLFDQSEAPHR
jgi:hypothetical protein